MKDRPLHEPVMLNEAMGALNPINGGIYLDATFGCGGYSRAILERADCQVFAIDKDPTAVERGRNMQAQFNGRLFLAEGCFSKMKALIYRQFSKKTKLAGATFDLGLCSTQIDEGQRGFSFQKDGPLDMRMSQSGESAADILMRISEKDLAQILWDYGEEKASRRIAKAICNARSKNRISRTVQLATIIQSVMPTKKPNQIDPATRSFQALRIFVNRELEILRAGLRTVESLLQPGGILAVVSFHSLEDRIVKKFLYSRSQHAPNPSRHLPVPKDRGSPTFELIFRKALTPSTEEQARNRRSRSAKLRVARRIRTFRGKSSENFERAT